MKKRIIAIVLLLCIAALPFVLAACAPSEYTPTIVSINAELREGVAYRVSEAGNDVFRLSDVAITVVWSDESETNMSPSGDNVLFKFETTKVDGVAKNIFNNTTELRFNNNAAGTVTMQIAFLNPLHTFNLTFEVLP
jgi:hypothetical protein